MDYELDLKAIIRDAVQVVGDIDQACELVATLLSMIKTLDEQRKVLKALEERCALQRNTLKEAVEMAELNDVLPKSGENGN